MARTPRKANVYERKNFFLEIPRQDFAAEKSVILSQQQMIQNLQKMNRFVFGQLEGVVKEKAKIYGVESAPSIQQVKDINAHNERLQETEAFLVISNPVEIGILRYLFPVLKSLSFKIPIHVPPPSDTPLAIASITPSPPPQKTNQFFSAIRFPISTVSL